jgi:hypothetical protein
VVIPFKATFGPRFIQAKVVGVDFVKKVVMLDNGDPVSYTDLVRTNPWGIQAACQLQTL